jgi:hypothetical protein
MQGCDLLVIFYQEYPHINVTIPKVSKEGTNLPFERLIFYITKVRTIEDLVKPDQNQVVRNIARSTNPQVGCLNNPEGENKINGLYKRCSYGRVASQ